MDLWSVAGRMNENGFQRKFNGTLTVEATHSYIYRSQSGSLKMVTGER